jgi:hypothetical protein
VFDLYPNGERVAILDLTRRRVSVFEIDSGHRLVDVSILEEDQWQQWLAVRPDGQIRLYGIEKDRRMPQDPCREFDGTLSIVDIDPKARVVTQTLRVGLPECSFGSRIRWSTDHTRVLLLDRAESSVWLIDGRNGTVMRDALSRKAVDSNAVFSSDGRIVVLESDETALQLRVFSRDGAETRTIQLGAHESARIAGEPAGDRLLVAVGPEPRGPMTILLADLSVGEVREIASDLRPLGDALFYRGDSIVKLGPSGEERVLVER